MNLKKWAKPGVPLEVLALKLCEEVGEVSGEITDGWKRDGIDRKAALEELDHVIGLAEIMKDRLSA